MVSICTLASFLDNEVRLMKILKPSKLDRFEARESLIEGLVIIILFGSLVGVVVLVANYPDLLLLLPVSVVVWVLLTIGPTLYNAFWPTRD
jgi:hypothetical protein